MDYRCCDCTKTEELERRLEETEDALKCTEALSRASLSVLAKKNKELNDLRFKIMRVSH